MMPWIVQFYIGVIKLGANISNSKNTIRLGVGDKSYVVENMSDGRVALRGYFGLGMEYTYWEDIAIIDSLDSINVHRTRWDIEGNIKLQEDSMDDWSKWAFGTGKPKRS